jgi:hypothetical protein
LFGLALAAVLLLDTPDALDFFVGMRTSKKRQTGTGRTDKSRQACPNWWAFPVIFAEHNARLSPERAGLQAVGAIIWCAALAGFRQDRCGRWGGRE